MGIKLFYVGLFILLQTVLPLPAADIVGSIVMGIGTVLLILDK